MRVIITAYSFVAAVIGAGFASGQEILSFFVVFGKWGIAGIVLAAALFGFFAYAVLNACLKLKTDNYNLLADRVMGKAVRKASDLLTAVFMMCSFAVMTACFGETLYLIFGADKVIASVIFVLAIALISTFGAKNALKLNGILGIIISFGIISSVLYLLRYREHSAFSPQISAVVSGAEYSGYNLIGMGVILASMSGNIKNRAEAVMTGIISGVSLFVITVLIFGLLSIYYKYISLGEIPVLTIAMRENRTVTYIYGFVLLLAVITTAVSNSVGITELIRVKNKYNAFLVSFTGLMLSFAGFSDLINTAYKLCGYIGIIFLLIFLKKLKNVENQR